MTHRFFQAVMVVLFVLVLEVAALLAVATAAGPWGLGLFIIPIALIAGMSLYMAVEDDPR